MVEVTLELFLLEKSRAYTLSLSHSVVSDCQRFMLSVNLAITQGVSLL